MIIGSTTVAYACSCAPYALSFCASVKDNGFRNIITAAVIYPGINTMQVVKIEDLYMKTNRDTITILGHDGVNCNESLGKFELGDTIILAIHSLTEDSFDLSRCGLFHLNLDKGFVLGNIGPNNIRQKYEEFKTSLLNCLAYRDYDATVKMLPNPTGGDITYFNDSGDNITGVFIYNVLGKYVSVIDNLNQDDLELNISSLPAGAYFIKTQMERGVFVRKVVKL